MSTIVELPDGHTATLRDDTELTNKQSKSLNHAMKVAAGISLKMKDAGYTDGDPTSWVAGISGLSEEDLDSIDLYQRSCVIMRLVDWTLDRDLPTNAEDVDELPISIYKPLILAATQSEAAFDTSPEAAIDPKAPESS